MSYRNLKVKIIGTGGIGGCLIDPLCRVLNYGSAVYSFGDVEIGLIDGDEYEERNRDRQAFRERGNKADVTARRLEKEFPNLVFRSHPVYIDEANIGLFIEDGDVVFLCVDNHKTRRMVTRHCEDVLKDVVLISGGNNLTDGNMQVFIREKGQNLTDPLDSVFHPEIANPTDKHPSEVEIKTGCLAMVASAPQLLIANNMAAALMLNGFHDWLTDVFSKEDAFRYDEVQFDLRNNSARSICRSGKQDIAALVKANVKKKAAAKPKPSSKKR